MAEFRYRAYLSYSHQDQRWAAWLHAAIEGYHVPRRLRQDAERRLPARLSPVFRDREDLSSASDLSGRLLEALAQSQAMIVICSPAAAASRWVNEEIRQFIALGRREQIHCMVVDGDPQAPAGEGGCFPPALFEGVGEAGTEPLAADPRPFADGKRLARLKIVAGLLGVRLDTLRRRDLARRRRWQLLWGVGALAALALAVVAMNAHFAEQRERRQAEQMATFIIDLSEELQSELDLESLARMSSTAMGYLDRLEPERLSADTQSRVGLALRQMGQVNQQQGKYREALGALERSYDVFADLAARFPEHPEAVFELSQAEFWLANYHLERDEDELARAHLQRYHEIAQREFEANPDDRTWLLELSYATSNLVNFRLAIGEPISADILAALEDNIALAAQAMDAWDGDVMVMSHYANELAFTADAQLDSCELESARQTRMASLALAQTLVDREPGNQELALDVVYRHSSLGRVLSHLGQVEAARREWQSASDLLEGLVVRNPSSRLLAEQIARSRRVTGWFHRLAGEYAAARRDLDAAEGLMAPMALAEDASDFHREEYLKLLEESVRLALAQGDAATAAQILQSHRDILARLRTDESGYVPHPERQIIQRYLTWRLEGHDPATGHPELQPVLDGASSSWRSCDTADWVARHAFLVGDIATARSQMDYLARAGYRDPDFLEFCRREGLCDE